MWVWAGFAVSTSFLIAAAQIYGPPDQASKSFDVASVKRLEQPRQGTSSGGGPGTSDPGRLLRSNVTLASLLVEAFHVQGHAIAGPDWLISTRYEIMATVPAGTKRSDIPLMLQRLIIERFGLKFHREQKEMPGYAIVTGRNGPKLKLASDKPAAIAGRDGYPDLPEGIGAGVIQVDSVGYLRRVAAGAMSMGEFADYLAGQSDLPVVDLTELRGRYDIVLYYSKPLPLSATATQGDSPFDLHSALRDQLGLELQRRKVRVELFVIDRIEETPSPN
jgi:uncharacterized protein (TIGR03435 family)